MTCSLFSSFFLFYVQSETSEMPIDNKSMRLLINMSLRFFYGYDYGFFPLLRCRPRFGRGGLGGVEPRPTCEITAV